MFKKRVPAYYIAISILATAIAAVFIGRNIQVNAMKKADNIAISQSSCRTKYDILKGYSYVSPLIYVDYECESQQLTAVKGGLINIISRAKEQGMATSVSVYIRTFTTGSWTSVDPENKYHPASLNKIPILITYLHMVEGNNSILNQQIEFTKSDTTLPHEYYTSKTIQAGKSYTVKDLLHYMIAFSDNNATVLLMQHMNMDIYNKVFTDLGLEKPSFNYDEFMFNVKDYSLFLRVLYDASYLSMPASEYALEIVADCDFKEGLVKQLPDSIRVVHKFGESGYGDTYELHESGIVYAGSNPYMITVMTKGTDLKKQATVISNISAQVYRAMLNSTF